MGHKGTDRTESARTSARTPNHPLRTRTRTQGLWRTFVLGRGALILPACLSDAHGRDDEPTPRSRAIGWLTACAVSLTFWALIGWSLVGLCRQLRGQP